MRVGWHAWIAMCLACVAGLVLWMPGWPALAQTTCVEGMINGGFESNDGWTFGLDPVQPQYVTGQGHSGQRSLLLGVPAGASSQRSYSSARQQVTIPANAGRVTLSFWYLSTMTGSPPMDYVEMAILAPDGQSLLDKPWRSFVDNRIWNQISFDLTGWRGQTIQVYFNVYNDGSSPAAGMYLDDVSLTACADPSPGATVTSTLTPAPVWPTITMTPTPSPMPTITMTPTPSPMPTITMTPTPSPMPTITMTPGPVYQLTPVVFPPQQVVLTVPAPAPTAGPPLPNCVDLVLNGDFEQGLTHWGLAPNKLMPILVGAPNVRGGNYAARLGTQERSDVESYSSIRQTVGIPSGYAQVLLQFSTWTWAESGGADHQEADFLLSDPAFMQKFWRVLSNDRAWVLHSYPVTSYAGRDVLLYFNVYNDGVGGRAAMFLDDVHLWACPMAGTQGLPVGTISPAAAPGATVTGSASAQPVLGSSTAVLPDQTSAPAKSVSLAPSSKASPGLETTVTPTPTPGKPAASSRLLGLPPLPSGWPLGVLALLVVGGLLYLAFRRISA